ncbi:hypothetical protein JG687_00014318 [Phytophthora cactorum]|uniref:Uncharacterized protein n=1 Tax=Phytophthora cactorum TaxID=29920 RepID=A0A8T1TZ19_9STRA|nr:hypothetical protein JG687_00014318 [Phytophthora cactorum]
MLEVTTPQNTVRTNFSSSSSLSISHLECLTPHFRPTAKSLLRVQPNKCFGYIVTTPSAPRSHTTPVLRLSVADYHLEHRRRRNTRSMIRQTAESNAPDSSNPRAPPRGNDLLFEELEKG